MATKMDPDEVAQLHAENLFARAYELQREKETITRMIAANRQDLRNLSVQGFLSDSQYDELLKLYPPRTRSNGVVVEPEPVA